VGVGGKVGKERMQWMTGVCNAWEMEDLARLDETAMDKLLDEGWERGRYIPAAKDLGIRKKKNLACLRRAVPQHIAIHTTAAFVLGVITATTVLLTFRPRY
jgi:precorrin-2 dehydrogenase/sirohydrochlorin ferrochelatase